MAFIQLADLFLLGSSTRRTIVPMQPHPTPVPPVLLMGPASHPPLRCQIDFQRLLQSTSHSNLLQFSKHKQEPGHFHAAQAKRSPFQPGSCWCLGGAPVPIPYSSVVSRYVTLCTRKNNQGSFSMLHTETLFSQMNFPFPFSGTPKGIAAASQNTYSTGGCLDHSCIREKEISLGCNDLRPPKPWLAGKRRLQSGSCPSRQKKWLMAF